MVIVGEDIRIDDIVFESNRTDNWVYSFNTFSRLEACKEWGWEEEEKGWEEENRRTRVKRRRRKGQQMRQCKRQEKNWPGSQWKQKFHGVVASDAALCGERSVNMKAKLSLASRSLMTSGRRDHGGHQDNDLANKICRKDQGTEPSHCFLDCHCQLLSASQPILAAAAAAAGILPNSHFSSRHCPPLLLQVLAEGSWRVNSKLKRFVPALHK